LVARAPGEQARLGAGFVRGMRANARERRSATTPEISLGSVKPFAAAFIPSFSDDKPPGVERTRATTVKHMSSFSSLARALLTPVQNLIFCSGK